MEVLLEKSTPTNATLTIKLAKEDYQPKVDKTIKDYSKRVALKGFRPGKVPANVIQRMYGKSIVIDEVNNLLSETVSNYIRDNKLAVVGDPQIDREKTDAVNWDKQTEFEFSYELGLASDFEVNIGALPAVSSYTIEAGEKELNDTIENLRTQFTGQINPETSEAGDMLYGELKQVGGEFSTKTAIPSKQIKEEAQAKFVGLTKGSEVTFDIRDTFVDDKAIALLTGKKEEEIAEFTGEYAFVVEDITRQAPSEINQEFFDKVLGVGKAEDEESFRSQVAEIIQRNYAREADSLLRRDIDQLLLDNIQIDLPEAFLKDWLFQLNEGKFTAEQIDADYPQFTKSLKLSLIKNKLAEQTEIKVDQSEVIARAEDMVREQFGIYGDSMGDQMEETIRKIAMNYLTTEKENNYSKMFNLVFDDKVFEYLSGQVAVEAKTIDVEQFKEIVNALS
ncbi:trigger factor [Runella defluvii]|uniref:Trigger factor n=1 Tax=Runella defluvii TaxID=370973 RepID=A0A7W5ZIJ1_9BACT|nr:trigger factor [Runella defluvii]MBB3836539.1 trigger factor [Runella defluvii]HAK76836.1 trigger factor [Runella sp.]HAO48327.1 trigger factor [Runella sp.]